MSENQTTVPETTEAPAPVKLTRREKLVAKYNAAFAKHSELATQLQDLASEINAIDTLASLAPGHTVFITVGRKDEAREVSGIVVGIKEDEEGAKVVKVAYGSGFDSDIAVVPAGKIRLTATPVQEQTQPNQG